MKVQSKRNTSQASKVFTDREEPRKAFWKTYEIACKNRAEDNGEIKVLAYYGIGGIGKSSLLNRLMQEMEERLTEPLYVSFDFDVKQDCRAVLESMRNILCAKYRFSFPLFDMGLYLYAQKIGESVESPEIKGLVSKSPTLDLILSIGSELPVIGFTSKLIGLADKTGAYLANLVSSHKKELYEIESKEPTELYQYLPYLFAQDMADAMAKQKEPLVVFFDTYEQLVNEMARGNALNYDLWIRGEKGLIQNIPNVLWVIAGREKLKWNTEVWGDSLEQHLLGTLSAIDAEHFLENAGITDAALRTELFRLTKGTPVYLDLCVDRYCSLCEEGTVPAIEQFGDNEQTLIERFVRYMDDAKKEMVYFLSCLDSWTDEMIYGIGGDVMTGSFNMVTYQSVKGLSFFSESEDHEFTMHQIVRKVLYENCPEVLKKRAFLSVIAYCEEQLLQCNLYSSKYETYLNYILGCVTKSMSEEEIGQFFDEKLREKYYTLATLGRFDSAYIGIDLICSSITDKESSVLMAKMAYFRAVILGLEGKFRDALTEIDRSAVIYQSADLLTDDRYLETLRTKARILFQMGDKEEPIAICRKTYDTLVEKYGERNKQAAHVLSDLVWYWHEKRRDADILELAKKSEEILGTLVEEADPIYLDSLRSLGVCYKDQGEGEKSIEIFERIYRIHLEKYGENSIKTLTAKANLAAVLSNLNRREESIQIDIEVLQKRRELLGDRHPGTLLSMNNLSLSLLEVGQREEAYEMIREAYEGRKMVLGEEHPDTISSLKNLCICLKKMERWEEYYHFCSIHYELLKRIEGDESEATIALENAMIFALQQMQRQEEAEELVLDIERKRKNVNWRYKK